MIAIGSLVPAERNSSWKGLKDYPQQYDNK